MCEAILQVADRKSLIAKQTEQFVRIALYSNLIYDVKYLFINNTQKEFMDAMITWRYWTNGQGNTSSNLRMKKLDF